MKPSERVPHMSLERPALGMGRTDGDESESVALCLLEEYRTDFGLAAGTISELSLCILMYI